MEGTASERGALSAKHLRPLARLVPYAWAYKGTLGAALVFLLLSAATTLTLPLAVRRMINEGFDGASGVALGEGWFGALFAIAAILAVTSAARYYFVIVLGERVVADLRRDVFAHVARLDPGFHDRSQSGEIASRLTADTTQVKAAMGATASMALRNTILAVGAVALMVWTSPRLSTVTILTIPAILLPLVFFGRSVRARARAAQDRLAGASAFATEAIGAVRELQAAGNEAMVSNSFGRAVRDAFEAARLSIRARAFLVSFAIFATFASVVLVLWIGAGAVADGRMDAGELTQFLLYAIFAATAMGGLSEVWGELSQAAGSAERLSELLEEVPAIRAPADPATLPAPTANGSTLRFEDVTLAYPTRPGDAAVDTLSFEARPGETLAIVGPSGAGKSSVFALALRFYDPQAGTVRLDGVPLPRLDPEDARARFALVPQDVTVFAMSARENIRFGRPDATDGEVEDAARAAHAHDFIIGLPDGYDTELGERGVMLSGGQRQRIAIARAVLRDAPILLLDEATSALDAESEHLVQQALERLGAGRTTLVIAHRLATVLEADRILVMDRGRLVEQGTHAELVAKGGTYARLAALQFDRGRTDMNAQEAAE